ncbi:MAG: VanZ family protein [Prevotellaceae bacterium]|nr:VanZ family protein [Candidatus Faecinaster equi]
MIRWKLFVITIIAGLAISFTTESMQYLFRIGLFEFDDLFHNGLGIVIGFLMRLLFVSFLQKKVICKRT